MKKLIYATLFALLAAAVHGQTIYNLRAAYDTAHPNNFVIDFNNYGPAGTFYPSINAPTPGGPVTFDGIPSVNDVEILSSSTYGIATSGNFVLRGQGQFLADSLLITLPANTFSFGTDIISPSSTVDEPYKFTLFSGATTLATLVSPSVYGSYTFFGFDSLTSPITSIAVQIPGPFGVPDPILDNFTVVPEPSTWLAAALALGVIGFSQRKRLRGVRRIESSFVNRFNDVTF